MSEYFRGKIDELFLVAGPPGCGKSTLLDNIESLVLPESLPGSLPGLIESAASYTSILKLKTLRQAYFGRLCVHLDISGPLRRNVITPTNRENLLKVICTERYAAWQELTACIESAGRLHIVTLLVDREEIFRRWLLGRALKNQVHSGVDKNLAAIYGDMENNSELHRRLYGAWLDFARLCAPDSMITLDANTRNYRVITGEEVQEYLAG